MRRPAFILRDDGAGGHGSVGDVTGGSTSITEESFVGDATGVTFGERIGQDRVDSVDETLRKCVAVEYRLLGKFVKRFLIKETVIASGKQGRGSKYIEYLFHILY
jgi:hypothetical protein